MQGINKNIILIGLIFILTCSTPITQGKKQQQIYPHIKGKYIEKDNSFKTADRTKKYFGGGWLLQGTHYDGFVKSPSAELRRTFG